jgi:hypothetical protein
LLEKAQELELLALILKGLALRNPSKVGGEVQKEKQPSPPKVLNGKTFLTC